MPMPTPNTTSSAITITYVGGPTAVIEICGMRFLTDPTFDAPGPYRSGSVALEKTEGPAMSVAEVGRIDLVLLSHDQHPDNLDREGRALVGRVPTLTTPAGAARLGAPAIGLAPWESQTFTAAGGCRLVVTATPARHGPAGIEPISGDVTGFVVSAVDPPQDLIYISGDTVWFGGTAEIARRFSPVAVLLFTGAARTRGAFHLTADSNDAVEFATAFADATIVPVHHAGWAHYSESQADLLRTFEVLRLTERVRPVQPAATVTVPLPR